MIANEESMSIKKLKYWGWGNTDEGLTDKETDLLLSTFAKKFGILPKNKVKVPKLDDIKLPTSPGLTGMLFSIYPLSNP